MSEPKFDASKEFEQKEIKGDKLEIDEITMGELHNISQPISLSDDLKKILGSDLGLLIVNKESKAIRIVKVQSNRIVKVVIYLEKPLPFIQSVIKFYKQKNIEIVFTTGICFRGKKLEDCVYEAYLDLVNSPNVTEFQMIEELQSLTGVKKIFVSPVELLGSKSKK